MNSKFSLLLIILSIAAGCAQQPAKQAVAPIAAEAATVADAPVVPDADVAAAPGDAPSPDAPVVSDAPVVPDTAETGDASIPATPPPKAAASKSTLPNVELTAQTLYQFLLAEIAGQRGKPDMAVEGILDLAKSTRDARLAKRATDLALQSQQEDRALEAARLWLILDPQAARARQIITALLVESGRLDEAKIYLERLLADEEDRVGAAFLSLHQVMSHQSNMAGVLDVIQELAKPYPQIAEAHFAVAQAALLAEKDELALREITEASRLRPDWESAALLQGQILQRAGASQALDFFKNYLDAFPKALTVRLTYARLLVSEKRYTEARNQFEKLVADFPQNAEVSVALGLLSMQLRDFDKAELYLKQALTEKYHDANSVRMYLGQLHEERKQYEEAADWYNNVTPGDHGLTAQLKYAAMLSKLNRIPEALQFLHRIDARTNQQRVQVTVAEAQILRAAKEYQKAFDLLSSQLEKLPNFPDLLYEHAMAADKIGRFDTLEQDLRKLIRLKPDYAHAYNALGYTFAERGERLEEARQLIEKALKLAPDDPFIMDSLGWAQYRLGALDQALDHLRRAYAEQPDPEIAAHLGEVLWVQGKHEEAGKIWQSALKENPDNEALLNAIKKFKP
ncbi:MAG: tetratricopeptide repeat protein [Sulfuricellaceae bacterium]